MFACTFLSLLQILSTEIMEADDKKTEDLHIVPGVVPTMDEYHCHSSNGSSCSSSNHRNAPLHKNGIHAAVTWSYCAPKLGSDILLQCQSPSVASSDHNHSASDVSGEETDFDELGDLLRRFGKFDFYIYQFEQLALKSRNIKTITGSNSMQAIHPFDKQFELLATLPNTEQTHTYTHARAPKTLDYDQAIRFNLEVCN